MVPAILSGRTRVLLLYWKIFRQTRWCGYGVVPTRLTSWLKRYSALLLKISLFCNEWIHLVTWSTGKTHCLHVHYFLTCCQLLVFDIQGDKVVQSAPRGAQDTHFVKKYISGVIPIRALVGVIFLNTIFYCVSCNSVQEDSGPLHSRRTAVCINVRACANSHGQDWLHRTIDGSQTWFNQQLQAYQELFVCCFNCQCYRVLNGYGLLGWVVCNIFLIYSTLFDL